MISELRFAIDEFGDGLDCRSEAGESSVSPTVNTDRKKTGGSVIYPARGGVARTAHSLSPLPGESEIFAIARPLVVKEILALLGDDIPSPTKHAKHLNKLSFADLCARRDQLLIEKQEQLKAEELRREPELPTRPLRQTRFFYGRNNE